MRFCCPCLPGGVAVYLLVQYEVKDELGAKSFDLEACLGQMDSLKAKDRRSRKRYLTGPAFHVDFLCIFMYQLISLEDWACHLGSAWKTHHVSNKEHHSKKTVLQNKATVMRLRSISCWIPKVIMINCTELKLKLDFRLFCFSLPRPRYSFLHT